YKSCFGLVYNLGHGLDYLFLHLDSMVYQLIHLLQVQQDKKVWSACTNLICFSIVEWHQTYQVRLQFGFVQDLPQPPKNLDALHEVDKRGNQDANWTTKHAQWIEYWSHCRDQVLQGPQIQYPIHTQEYMIWYRKTLDYSYIRKHNSETHAK
ncbi:hypothetical protein Lal_00030106, partial [Lupinus albus]